MILKSDQLLSFNMQSGIIPEKAFREAYYKYAETNPRFAIILKDRIGAWDNAEANPWTLWKSEKYEWKGVQYSGSWTTRFAKLWRILTEEKIDETLLSEVGAYLGQYQKETEYFFQTTRIFHWSPGDFGERDGKSCWWQSNYGHSRVGLAARDYGYAALFYKDREQFERHGGKIGIGRAWVVNQEDKAFIFNAYGVPLSKMALALAEANGLQMKKVGIYSPGVYINKGNMNNEGLDGGSGGLGYLLAPDVEAIKLGEENTYNLPSFGENVAHCHHCHEAKKPKELVLRGTEIYCLPCKKKLFPTCRTCDREVPGEKVFLRGEGLVHVCKDCIKGRSLDKKEHFCSVHGMTFDTTIRVWHTDIYACETCQREQNIYACRTCGRVEKNAKSIVFNGYTITQNYMCRSCRRRLAKSILQELEATP